MKSFRISEPAALEAIDFLARKWALTPREAVEAALRKTKIAYSKPKEPNGGCDYRKEGCVNQGVTINGRWVCLSHISDVVSREKKFDV